MAQCQKMTTNNSLFLCPCSCFHGQNKHPENDYLSIMEGRVGIKGTNLVIGCVPVTVSLVGGGRKGVLTARGQ